eukprot:CAMPEP_0172616028 /NCGR_PEP_ID=MMETSP1068-20121228/62666_1 /TAXON_ID=35684 /ORGANISM="Pseudopedinella elastica, Strain CCMP716" /LENGTH=241 /DNA_ID=CAMNT_0013421345 /DNA_START=73 /DNA_END=798 /DNA_ORIENTATION=-
MSASVGGSGRADDRLAHEMRPPALEEGLLHQADGSARLSLGNTMVLAGVHGPALGRGRSERPEVLSIEVVLGTPGGGAMRGTSGAAASTTADALGYSYKAVIQDVLARAVMVDRYPRSTLVVVLRVLRDDGGALAALVNAAVAALMDAGVEMARLPVASNFALPQCTPVSASDLVADLIADPDAAEERKHPTVTVVCDKEGELLALNAAGIMNPTLLPRCIDSATSVTHSFGQLFRMKSGL